MEEENEEDEEDDLEATVQNDIKKVKKQNVIAVSAAPALPGVVLDDHCYRLIDLFNSDFKMPESDKDFELTHE